jgi:hypothetical protein
LMPNLFLKYQRNQLSTFSLTGPFYIGYNIDTVACGNKANNNHGGQ